MYISMRFFLLCVGAQANTVLAMMASLGAQERQKARSVCTKDDAHKIFNEWYSCHSPY
jgi:hypothetical protein